MLVQVTERVTSSSLPASNLTGDLRRKFITEVPEKNANANKKINYNYSPIRGAQKSEPHLSERFLCKLQTNMKTHKSEISTVLWYAAPKPPVRR